MSQDVEWGDREYRDEYAGRVKTAVELYGRPSWFVAKMLRVNEKTWLKYEGMGRAEGEKTTYLPQHLVADFCMLTGVNVEWLVAGTGQMLANYQRPQRRSRETVA